MVKLSIVIPAYNEEEGIGNVINDIKKVMKKVKLGYEIIVVDDGSVDKTAEIVKKRQVKLIQHPYNKGYGAAIKTGIRNAAGDLVLITDSDGSYPAEDIPKLLEHSNDYDMVVGARIGKVVNIPLLRRPAKYFLNKLANFLVGVKIPDLNSGLRVFKKAIALKFMNIYPSKFSFTTTITLAFLSSDYTVKYVPISYYKRKGESKMKPWMFSDFLVLIVRIITYFNPLKVFLPISILLFLASASLYTYSALILYGLLGISTEYKYIIIVLVLTAIQIGFFGLLADLIRRKK